MQKFWSQKVLVLILATSLSACGSSKKNEKEGMEGLDDIPVADATDTDALPQDTLENPDGVEALPEVPQEPMDDLGGTMPMDSVAGTGEWVNYTVQSGDTLMKIAFETYGDVYKWRAIYNANLDVIRDFNSISSGAVLKVERTGFVRERNGEPYLIKVGDTLGTISSSVYGTPSKWRKLWDNNRQLIKNPDLIYAGFYLYYQPEAGGGMMTEETNPEPLAGGMGSDDVFGADEIRSPSAK